jgi:hypothetical protein
LFGAAFNFTITAGLTPVLYTLLNIPIKLNYPGLHDGLKSVLIMSTVSPPRSVISNYLGAGTSSPYDDFLKTFIKYSTKLACQVSLMQGDLNHRLTNNYLITKVGCTFLSSIASKVYKSGFESPHSLILKSIVPTVKSLAADQIRKLVEPADREFEGDIFGLIEGELKGLPANFIHSAVLNSKIENAPSTTYFYVKDVVRNIDKAYYYNNQTHHSHDVMLQEEIPSEGLSSYMQSGVDMTCLVDNTDIIKFYQQTEYIS